MPKVLGEAKLGSTVCFDNRDSNIRLEKDQKETADKEDSLERAEDLEKTGWEGEKRQSYKDTWLPDLANTGGVSLEYPEELLLPVVIGIVDMWCFYKFFKANSRDRSSLYNCMS